MFVSNTSERLGEREMLRKHEPTSKCFHSIFQFSQIFPSVSITRLKYGEHVFYFFFRKNGDETKEDNLFTLITKA